MIRLVVEDYCHNCPDFEAEVHVEKLYLDNYDVLPIRPKNIYETMVTCAKAHRCAAQVRYLERKIKENGNVSE